MKRTRRLNIKSCTCNGRLRPVVSRNAIGPGLAVVCQSCFKEGPQANYKDEAKFKWREMIKQETA